MAADSGRPSCGVSGCGEKGQRPVWVRLPDGDDPNRFFVGGGGAAAFSRYLEEADQ